MKKNTLMRVDDRLYGAWKYVLLLLLISSIVLIPYGWLIVQSFINPEGFFSLENWTFMTQETMIRHGVYLPIATKPILNSLKFATLMALCVVPVTVCAAYALSRTDFKGRNLMARLLIIMDAFPQVALLTSFIILLSKMHLTNKLIGVIFLKVAMYLPGSIWLMKGFFDHINWDIEWAAIVDGASRFKTFLRVIVPAAKPGIAVILVNSFLSGWGEYILISIFMRGKATTMSNFIGSMLDAEDGKYLVSAGILAAACIAYIVPVILIFIFSQKTLLEVRQGGSKQ
jgi:ABC-type maltose transport systems, permease component